MANSATYNAATNAQRETLKNAAIRLDKAINASRDGGIEAGTKAPNVDVDVVGAAAAAALSAVGYSGNSSTDVTVSNGDSVSVLNSASADSHTGTAVVASGALTGVTLAATVAMVDNSDSVSILPASGSTASATGTAAVASGAVTGVRLGATTGIVTNGQTLAVTGGTVTIAVAANVVTATYTAST